MPLPRNPNDIDVVLRLLNRVSPETQQLNAHLMTAQLAHLILIREMQKVNPQITPQLVDVLSNALATVSAPLAMAAQVNHAQLAPQQPGNASASGHAGGLSSTDGYATDSEQEEEASEVSVSRLTRS